LQKAVAECQQKIAAFVQQVQQGQGIQTGGGGGGVGRGGMRLGGGGMDLSSDMSDAEMARYMRSTQAMQVPGGYRAGSDDMMTAMMTGAGGGRDDGGFFSMPGGASSFAPFARQPPNALGMSRGADGMGGGRWQLGQLQGRSVDSLGVGGPMRQGMYDTGPRDSGGGAQFRPFSGRADEDITVPAAFPPPVEQPQPQQPQQQPQQQQGPSVKKSADESRESGVSKPRVVRLYSSDAL